MSQNKELPLVVCSVDGALLGQHGRLLACDELTIRLYCAMGGRFSALTYRTPQGLEALFPGKNRIGPSVCCGGSLVYSPASGLVTYAARLEEGAARAAVRDALDQFPEVSAQIIHANGKVYVPRGNPYLHAQRRKVKDFFIKFTKKSHSADFLTQQTLDFVLHRLLGGLAEMHTHDIGCLADLLSDSRASGGVGCGIVHSKSSCK